VPVDVAATQPAVFEDTSASATQGIVLAVRGQASNQVQFEATPASPAKAGDAIVIYCAGLGAVSHQPTDCVAVFLSPSLRTTSR